MDPNVDCTQQLSNLYYERTQSSDGGVGQMYETKMTAFMLLRLHNITDEFYLANNFSKGGKFDDLVFSFRKSRIWSTWFVQLKHRSDTNKKKISVSSLRSKKGNQDFYLPKYYDSFKSIRNRFILCNDANDKIFSQDFSGANFIIYTNAILDHVLQARERSFYRHPLATRPETGLIFKFHPEIDNDVVETLNDGGSEFMDQLIMFTGQASEETMNDIIDKEIRVALKVDGVDARSIALHMYNYLQNWYKESSYLTKVEVNKILSGISLETSSNKKSELDVEFCEAFIENALGKPLNRRRGNVNGLLIGCDSIKLGLAAVKQALAKNKCLWFNLTEIWKNLDLLNIWEQSDKEFFVIDCEMYPTDINTNVLRSFLEAMSEEKKQHIVFLACTENQMISKLCSQVNLKKITFNCSLKDLTKHVREMMFERYITFQGYDVKILKLFEGNKDMSSVFNMNMLDHLVSCKPVIVGVKPVDKVDYYVSRILQRSVTLNLDILKYSYFTEILAISGAEIELIKPFIDESIQIVTAAYVLQSSKRPINRIVMLSPTREREEYESLCSSFSGVNWIEQVKNQLKFKATNSDHMSILSHVENGKYDYICSDDIMTIEDKVVLITAEPGMGKSTLLAHMAAKTKKLYPHLWIINISLNDFTHWLRKCDFKDKNEELVKTFITEAAGVTSTTSKFDQRLFEHCFYTSGNMIILLDGFDEISGYEETVIQIIKVLMKSKITKVWITTRPIKREMLEKELSTVSFTIKSFERKDQEKFFHKYWKSTLRNIENDKLDLFIKKLMEVADNLFNNKETEFTGIPLQTRLLAEAYNEHVIKYNETGDLSTFTKVDVLQLFDKFVEAKFKILLEDKSNIALNLRYQLDQIIDQRYHELMQMALIALFKDSELVQITPVIGMPDIVKLKENVSKGFEICGIIVHFKDDIPVFVHRTFAEYFAALFFKKHLAENKTFLYTVMLKPMFSFVKYLLDRMLSKGFDLHTYILRNDLASCLEHIKQYPDDINSLDHGGRTPLHIASCFPNCHNILSQLLKYGADATICDKVMGWTPLQYAYNTQCWINVGSLLEQNPTRVESLHQDDYVKTVVVGKNKCQLIKTVFRQDMLSLYLFLTEQLGLDVLDKKREDSDVLFPFNWLEGKKKKKNSDLTLYHLAAYHGAEKLMKHLLDQKLKLPKSMRKMFIKLCVDLPDEDGKTPLHYAVINCKERVTAILLENDLNICAQDKQNKTPFYYAIKENPKMASLIFKKLSNPENVDVDRLFFTALKGHVKIVDLFIKTFPNVLSKVYSCGTPLMQAAKAKNVEMIKFLLKNNCQVNDLKPGNYSALHFAVLSGDVDCTFVLLDAGAFVDQKTEKGSTPLHLASQHGHLKIIEMLLQYEADVKCVDNNGNSVLHAAASNNKVNPLVIKLLIRHGANQHATNLMGKTFMDLFKENTMRT